MSILTNWDF